MQLSMFSLEEHPASPSRSQDSERVLMTPEAASCLSFLESLSVTGLATLSGKTSPVSCHQTEDGILVPSSGRWGTWGTGGPTECWTLNGSESPSDVVASSLWDVLEIGDVPEKYFLSAKACAGFLRRSEEKMDRRLAWAMSAVLGAESGGSQTHH